VPFLLTCGQAAQPTGELLQRDVRGTWHAFIQGETAKLYDRLPREARQRCSFEAYERRIMIAKMAFGDRLAESEIQIKDITINGRIATFTTVYLLDGIVVSSDQQQAYWEDGLWRELPPDEASPLCE
jgi:hypothetical protein